MGLGSNPHAESTESRLNRPSTDTGTISSSATPHHPEAEAGAGAGASRPHRPSCDLCRRRKVKCDRQQPCSICIQGKSDCVYPSRRGRAPKRSPFAVNAQLADRLSHLETLIKRFENHGAAPGGNVTTELHSPLLDSAAQLEPPSPSVNEQVGRLIIDESRSYYVSNALWASLASEIDELRGILLEPASDDKDEYMGPGFEDSFGSSPSLGSNAAMFGFRAIAYSLQPYHPSSSQSAALFSLFTENVAPLIRIFHIPTLCRIYQDAIASPSLLDKNTEALLFAIYYAAVISIDPDHCVALLGITHSTALDRNRFAAEQALARANLLNTQSMTLLQAAVLFVSVLRNQDDSRTSWSLTALLFHIAQAMGLHRDGVPFNLRPFETEMRRRLWWHICILDSRSSQYRGYEPIVHGGEASFDTRLPLHLNDSDLHPDMVEAPAERQDMATDMTLSLIRCEAMRTSWKFGHVRLGADREELVRELEQTLQEKYLRKCDTSVPYQLVSFMAGRLVINRFWLVTHYQLDPKSGTNGYTALNPNLDATIRDRLFLATVEILELSSLLLTNKELSKWSWYAKTHVQWDTLAFILSELCSRPPSPEYDRAWECITTVYNEWKKNGGEKDILWRPIRQLMARARYAQQMQPAAGQNCQHISPADLLLHLSAPRETLNPQMSSIPGSLCSPSTFMLHADPANNSYGAFDLPSLDPFMGLLPDLAVDTFGSLAGDENPFLLGASASGG